MAKTMPSARQEVVKLMNEEQWSRLCGWVRENRAEIAACEDINDVRLMFNRKKRDLRRRDRERPSHEPPIRGVRLVSGYVPGNCTIRSAVEAVGVVLVGPARSR